MVEKGLAVTKITPISYEGDVYNLHVEDNHNYFADGVNVTNCHLFKAKSLTTIMQNLTQCKYRFGFTGTLDGTETNQLILEGLFGKALQVTTTAELMKKQQVADLIIKAIVLKHSDEVKSKLYRYDKEEKRWYKPEYKDEIAFLVQSKKRNNFIKNLVLSLKGNTLLLFHFIEQGSYLYKELKEATSERSIYYIDGSVEGETREQIRFILEKEQDAIVVASFKTSSTGINIPSLCNVVFASPSKSRVRTLQSIGRGIRLSDSKTGATLYDIADDLNWKRQKNHTSGHFVERIKMYAEEQFQYKIYTVDLV